MFGDTYTRLFGHDRQYQILMIALNYLTSPSLRASMLPVVFKTRLN